MSTLTIPALRSKEPTGPVIADASKAPAFLRDVPAKWLRNDRNPRWADRAREFYLSKYGVVPSLLDLSREAERRYAERTGNVRAHTETDVEPLPMMSGTSPLTERGLARHEAKQASEERRLARRAAEREAAAEVAAA